MSAAIHDSTADAPAPAALLSGLWRPGFYAAASWLTAAVVTVAFPDAVPWGSRDLFAGLVLAGVVLLVVLAFTVDRLGRFGERVVHYGPWLIALGFWLALWEATTAKLGW